MARVIQMTTRQKPANATPCSTRKLAAAVGISEASLRRIWRAHGLKPHCWDAAYSTSLNRSFTFNPFR